MQNQTTPNFNATIIKLFLECWICLAEYFMILVVGSALLQNDSLKFENPNTLEHCRNEQGVAKILCVLSQDLIPITIALVKVLLRIVILVAYCYARYGPVLNDEKMRFTFK